jgi:multiple sugar transport system ATP-binding protein
MASIDIRNVHKNFGTISVLQGVDLTIGNGEFVVLVGPSGCGKSTLLRMIAGLEEVTEGEIRIGDLRVNERAPKDRDIAMVFQSYALYPHMNVAENMSYSLRIRKAAREKIIASVSSAAEKLGLQPLLERRPKALSGGQRQRVAMGRAIVRQPKAFLFDEPLSNLDARLREQMRAEIKKLHRDLGATSIYVTHDQIEAMTLADRIVAMHSGVVQQVGSPLELYDRPANLFVAGFIGSPAMNFLAAHYEVKNGIAGARLSDGTLIVLPSRYLIEEGAPVTLGIRPEHVQMSTSSEGDLRATVDLIEPTGFGIILHLGLHGLPFNVFTLERIALAAGPTVTVSFPQQHLHLFDNVGDRALESDLQIGKS